MTTAYLCISSGRSYPPVSTTVCDRGSWLTTLPYGRFVLLLSSLSLLLLLLLSCCDDEVLISSSVMRSLCSFDNVSQGQSNKKPCLLTIATAAEVTCNARLCVQGIRTVFQMFTTTATAAALAANQTCPPDGGQVC